MKPMPASATQRPTCSGVRSILTPSDGQHVGGARARRQRAVAVLGDRHAGARDDEGGAGRDVDRAGAVAAGADDVDGVGGRVDPQHLGAHRRDRAGDLVDGLAAHAQRHQQAAHLRGRGLAGHHAVEGGCRLLTRQRGAGRDFSDNRFEVVHRVLSGSLSCCLRAGHLREGGLVDGGADLGFELGDVLRDLLVGQCRAAASPSASSCRRRRSRPAAP